MFDACKSNTAITVFLIIHHKFIYLRNEISAHNLSAYTRRRSRKCTLTHWCTKCIIDNLSGHRIGLDGRESVAYPIPKSRDGVKACARGAERPARRSHG
ncbi:hypothetical protein EVAR_5640_1 [Eumeta japonica]|uniref:Uncharacterized protein n=1 Tax=Eumeta variegata TaxID=151549 RepID=A0A4C1T860_EUMVA|nr:hypothetical protein EVAR_5640_1 [Eumeta japonica]